MITMYCEPGKSGHTSANTVSRGCIPTSGVPASSNTPGILGHDCLRGGVALISYFLATSSRITNCYDGLKINNITSDFTHEIA
jgi:hypothetical protein